MDKWNSVLGMVVNDLAAWTRNLRPVVGAFALVALLAACQPVQPVDDTGEVVAQTDFFVSSSETGPQSAELAEDQETGELLNTAEETDGTETTEPKPVEDVAIDMELVAAGMVVYRAQYCGICHEFTPAGTTGRFGPPHDGVATTATLRLQDSRYAGEATTVEEYLYESLVRPSAYIVQGFVGTSHSMPPYTHLSEEDLHALVALLLTQR